MDFRESYSDACSSISQCARAGDLKTLKKLIKNKRPVDVQDNRGWRAIHEAAANNHNDCLSLLAKHKNTDLNWRTFEGETPLMLAVVSNHNTCISLLLSLGADPNISNNELQSPLHLAVREGNLDVVKALLTGGADVNSQDASGWSVMHEAMFVGSTDITNLLLEKKPVISVQESYGISLPFTACQYGSVACLRILIDYCKDQGMTQHDISQLLSKRTRDGDTAMFIAAQEGFSHCIELLIEYLPSEELADGTPLLNAIEHNHVRCVELLLPYVSHSSFPHAREKCLEPFRMAISSDRLTCLETLLLCEHLHPDDFGGFPLIYLQRISTLNKLTTPFSEALEFYTNQGDVERRLDLLRLFIRCGSCLNSLRLDFWPPLLFALGNYSLPSDFLEELILSGANIMPKTADVNYAVVFLLVSLLNPLKVDLLMKYGMDTVDPVEPTATELEIVKDVVSDQLIYPHTIFNVSETGISLCLASHYCVQSWLKKLARYFHFARFTAEIKEALQTLEINPRSLLHLCRVRIRRCVPCELIVQPWKFRNELCAIMPAMLAEFVQYKNIDMMEGLPVNEILHRWSCTQTNRQSRNLYFSKND